MARERQSWEAWKPMCAGRPVPSPVWVGSLYVRRDGKWLNAAYQQTKIAK